MKQLTKEEISEILKQHKIWLESEYTMGSRANLEGANLSGANLAGANLEGANLEGANLFRAKGVTIFQYEQHLAVAFKNNKYIKIGCKSYKTKNWVMNFEEVGKDEDYSNSQIKMYEQFINMINEN